jgi:hypothetical protein
MSRFTLEDAARICYGNAMAERLIAQRAEALKRADALNVFLYGPGSGAQPSAAGDLMLLGALSTLDKEPTP